MNDYSSRQYKDVQGFEEKFLVGRNEARNYNICVIVSYLSASQGRASETTWIVTTVTYSLMEMVTYIYGFCGWIAKVSTKSRYNMGYCRSTYQYCTFCCIQHDVFNRMFKSLIHSTHCTFTWCSCHHCIGSRLNFHRRIQEEFANSFRNVTKLELSLSSVN